MKASSRSRSTISSTRRLSAIQTTKSDCRTCDPSIPRSPAAPDQRGLIDAEGRRERPAIDDSAADGMRRAQMDFAWTLVVACIDKLDRPFDDFEHADVRRRANSERAEPR